MVPLKQLMFLPDERFEDVAVPTKVPQKERPEPVSRKIRNNSTAFVPTDGWCGQQVTELDVTWLLLILSISRPMNDAP